MPIEGQVARILDDESIVVNRGSADGVREGMRFVVFAEHDEVTDPATGRSLGRIEIVKARVVAAHVQERMATLRAEAAAARAASEDPTQRTLSSEMVAVSMSERSQAKLNVDRSAMTGTPKAGPVTLGDRVRSVEG